MSKKSYLSAKTLMETEIFDQIMDAVRESVESGFTPNYLFLGPEFSTNIPEDIVELSGMKVWRSPIYLPEGKPVIAIHLSSTKMTELSSEELMDRVNLIQGGIRKILDSHAVDYHYDIEAMKDGTLFAIIFQTEKPFPPSIGTHLTELGAYLGCEIRVEIEEAKV